jgi:hypothetical protein
MKRRYQTMAVGLFFVLLGLALLIYWILLPVPSKQQLLQEILNQTNISMQTSQITTQISQQYQYENIELSTSSIYYYIANNYTIGNYIPSYIIYLGNSKFQSNIFYGKISKEYYFYFSNNSLGVNLTAIFSCSNGYFDIYINGQEIYSGCQNGQFSIFIPSSYLIYGENGLKIEFVPDSIIFNGFGEINNLEIIYLQQNSLSFSYYYVSGNVYMYYDFCPYYPQDVELIVNNLSIPLSSCSGLFYLTPYLNIGENNIELISSYPVNINQLYLQSNQHLFFILFPNNIENNLLEVIVSKGEGTMILNNNCVYYVNSEQSVYAINISNCLLPENILEIRPTGYLYISYLQIS